MPPTLTSPIAERSCRSLQLFDRLSSLLEDKTSNHFVSSAICLDEFGRFRLWANNIGAFLSAEHPNSLDVRLREASKICSRIVEFLEDLIEALDDACAIVSGTKPNRIATGLASDFALGTVSEQSEFAEIFNTVKDTTRSLMQTSIIIRDATPRDRYLKAQSSTKKPFPESFDIAHISHKFPKVELEGPEWLKRRLGKANAQRRQYLKYCLKHHNKFSRRTEQDRPKLDVPTKSEVAFSGDVAPFHDVDPVPGPLYEAGTIRSASTSAFAPTDASTLHPSRLELGGTMAEGDAEDVSDSYSLTSYATSTDDDTSESKLRIPSLEDVARRRNPFECPYCWTLRNIRNERSWRKHVFADLRPYVCTFKECDLRLFADRQTWFKHEMKSHRVEWCCPFCSHALFRSEEEVRAHIERHMELPFLPDWSALVHISRRSVDQIPAADCPLCYWDRSLRDSNTQTSSDETLVVTPEQFRRHLGGHMEQLALFALPRSYNNEDEEGDANSNEAAAIGQSDTQSRRLSWTEAMSWKSNSSRGATLDSSISDMSPSIASHTGVNPWSKQSLDMNTAISLPRSGSAMSCSQKGDLYIHGGLANGVTVKNDVWIIETKETWTCYAIATDCPGPGPRAGHAAILLGDDEDGIFIIFGGDTKPTEDGSWDDALYLLHRGRREWFKIASGTRPSGRYGHTLNSFGEGLLVFGGQREHEFFNDLHAFNLSQLDDDMDNASWNAVLPNAHHPDKPPARANHTMVSWDENLILFGGTDGQLWFSDVWQFSYPDGWRQSNCVGNIPQSRAGHAAAVVDGVMYIFGGRSKEGHDLGDLAAFVIASRRWYSFQDMEASPSPRSGHRMCVCEEKILLVGGEPSDGANTEDLEAQELLRLIYTLDTSQIRFSIE